MENHSRFLSTNREVEDFLNISLLLNYKKDSKLKGIITQIVDGELGVSKFNTNYATISAKEMRNEKYRSDEDRWKLRERIISELWNKKRLEDDEKISLSKGGALPRAGVRREKQAFVIIGLPASGKSGIANEVSENSGAIIIDSDFAKRKLPEFKNHLYGASLVHEESKRITSGFRDENPYKIKSLYELSIGIGANIVIPTIGQNPKSIIDLANALKNNYGYKVHLILVSLSKREATIRAIYRFAKTKRYVPL